MGHLHDGREVDKGGILRSFDHIEGDRARHGMAHGDQLAALVLVLRREVHAVGREQAEHVGGHRAQITRRRHVGHIAVLAIEHARKRILERGDGLAQERGAHVGGHDRHFQAGARHQPETLTAVQERVHDGRAVGVDLRLAEGADRLQGIAAPQPVVLGRVGQYLADGHPLRHVSRQADLKLRAERRRFDGIGEGDARRLDCLLQFRPGHAVGDIGVALLLDPLQHPRLAARGQHVVVAFDGLVLQPLELGGHRRRDVVRERAQHLAGRPPVQWRSRRTLHAVAQDRRADVIDALGLPDQRVDQRAHQRRACGTGLDDAVAVEPQTGEDASPDARDVLGALAQHVSAPTRQRRLALQVTAR